MKIAYRTKNGIFYEGKIGKFLEGKKFEKYKGKINLIFTSPPFPLVRKKKYGNLDGDEYLEWLKLISKKIRPFLTPKGSIGIEIGNSWVKGLPEMSTLPLKSLLSFEEHGEYHLCQQFIWHNSAKLPSPAQWVNVERTRVKDSYTNIWWMSSTANPNENNRKVLTEYSSSMKRLLKNNKYNSGSHPSDHQIGKESFFKENKGAIPANVLILSSTKSSSNYSKYCKLKQIKPHPARMPEEIPEFFINLLTNKGDLIFDPFAGSNTTGEITEKLSRKWISIEPETDYINGSKGRFLKWHKS